MGRNVRRGIAAVVALATAGVIVLVATPPASAKHTVAKAVLLDASGAKVGTVELKGDKKHADEVRVKLDAPGAVPLDAFHGFHIHTVGSCVGPDFASAGGHWDPGGPHKHSEHAGDLPSVLIGPDGAAEMRFDTARLDVEALFDADGSAVILHAGRDNYANIPENPYGPLTEGTYKTGDAGSRYACGVVTR